MNGVQTRFKCKLDVKRCKRFVFPPSSLLPRSNALKTKAIRYFQTDRTLTRIVSPPLHYTFGGSSPSRPKTLSNTSLDLLIINTVVTFLYAYGLHKGNRVLCARAGSFLEELKAENNYITRMWEQCGMKASNAADSQALIQLKKEYCDKKKCLYCRIGYEYLKRS